MLTGYWDLEKCPPTYDIVAFLLALERYRLAHGHDRVELVILRGPADGFRRDRLWPFNTEERNKMLMHVAIPMATMLPALSVVRITPERKKVATDSFGFGARQYGLALQVDCMRDGIRPLRDKEPRARNARLVTITLREAEHWPERNSNVEEWCNAARDIQDMGYDVVFVRDTLRAGEALYGFQQDVEASHNLYTRAALYRSAFCNMFVSNGPAWFALALDAPVLMLKPTVEGVMKTCSADYFRRCGIEPGGQIPGAPDYQRIAWREDTAEYIVSAFASLVAPAVVVA